MAKKLELNLPEGAKRLNCKYGDFAVKDVPQEVLEKLFEDKSIFVKEVDEAAPAEKPEKPK